MRGLTRTGVVLMTAVALLLLPPAVRAAVPRIVLVTGPSLPVPVVLSDWGDNGQLLSGDERSDLSPDDLIGRPFFDLWLFWGVEWDVYVAAGNPLDRLRPEQANQHARFFPAVGDAEALLTIDYIPGPGAPVRGMIPEGLAVLAAHGVPVRLDVVGATPIATPVAKAPCPLTRPNGNHPPGEALDPGGYGNEALWTNLAMWSDQPGIVLVPDDGRVSPDGAIHDMKWAWYRYVPGRLTIEGRRLDAPAPPLEASIPSGYGDGGFQVSGLTFPSAGCWEITGRVGNASLTFVVLVVLTGTDAGAPISTS